MVRHSLIHFENKKEIHDRSSIFFCTENERNFFDTNKFDWRFNKTSEGEREEPQWGGKVNAVRNGIVKNSADLVSIILIVAVFSAMRFEVKSH